MALRFVNVELIVVLAVANEVRPSFKFCSIFAARSAPVGVAHPEMRTERVAIASIDFSWNFIIISPFGLVTCDKTTSSYKNNISNKSSYLRVWYQEISTVREIYNQNAFYANKTASEASMT